MFVIIGYIVVLLAVFGGYAIAGGHFGVLLLAAPLEVIRNGGAALGACLVGNNQKVLKATVATIPSLFEGSRYTKARYMSLLALLYDILQKARKEGLMAIEHDVDEPQESALFSNSPALQADHHLVAIITAYLRRMVSGNANAHAI